MHFDGAYAESIIVPEALLVPLADTLSYEEGALVEPLAVALHAVNITPLSSTDNVVVVGSGPIGLLTLLAARLRGAGSSSSATAIRTGWVSPVCSART